MNSPAATEKPPTTGLVGNYRLIRMIGKGGMGSVWEAQHVSIQTKAAIKFIETEHAISAEARARFEKEALAASKIGSKHAIQVFDNGVTPEGIPYIVMELLTGEALERRVERLSRMSLQETAKILMQAGKALAKAHEQGIIHRDLKPDNIFIVRDMDDGEEVAKVLDFGIAKMKGEPGNPGMTSSTKTGAVLGTPFYMSPEQARGLRNVDHRTDVWSLAVIAFRCVTGRLPFDGESVGDLLVKICTAPVPVPSQVVPGIPAGFDQWFMRSMEREPERRFGSVTEQTNELCYIAGIAGAANAPISHQQTVGLSSNNPNAAIITPHGMMASAASRSSGPHMPQSAQAASGYGYQPMTQPSPAHSSSNPSNPHFMQSGPQQPGMITNSPFTSEHVAGVGGGGKGKTVGIVVGVVAVLGIIGGGAFLATRHHEAAANSNPPPAASSAVPEPKAAELPKPADSAATDTQAAGTDTTPKGTEKPAETHETTHEGHKVGGKPASGPRPSPAPVGKPAPAPAPAPAAPAPAPAAGPKPNKNDPGY